MGFYIYKENNITLSINSSSIKIGNSVKLTPTVKDLTDNIPITSGTVEYYLSNGTKIGSSAPDGSFVYTPSKTGNYTFYAKYIPDENSNIYLECTSNNVDLEVVPLNTVVSADKVVNKTNSIMDIPVSVVDEFGVSVANGTVKSTIDGTEYSATVNDGKAIFKDVKLLGK